MSRLAAGGLGAAAAVVDLLPAGVALFSGDSADTVVLFHCNPAFSEIVGWPAEPGTRPEHLPYRYYPPERVTPLPTRHGPETWAISGETVRDREVHVLRADGTWRAALASAAPLRAAGGGIIGAVVHLQDVTECRAAESAIRDREAELAAISRSAPLIMLVVDGERRVHKASRMAQEAVGAAAADMLGRRAGEAMRCLHSLDDPRGCGFGPECQRCVIRGSVADTFETGRSHHELEATLTLMLDGGNEELTLLVSTAPLSVRGERRVLVTLQDITARKRVENALREADRRKDEYLAMLAHELRNPLAAISSAVQVLHACGTPDPVLRRAREAAARQAAHMARILDDLLDVSRMTRGKVALRTEDVRLATVVESAIEATAPLVEAREHRLFISLPHRPLRVRGDPVRLAQVVANLLSNAARYTPPGGEIRLSAEPYAEHAVICVRDTGVGMPPEFLPHVFDLFVQSDRGPDRAQGGLGIGLTMARALTEMHGGRIEARSDGPGKGSEFVVWLPLLRRPAAEASAARVSPSDSVPPRRILVVDDATDVADLLAMNLELDGHQVATANGGLVAIDMAVRDHPEVILLDIGMPGMDGYEAARRLRAEPALAGTLLVALTGYGQQEDRERTRAAGFDHHLVKPVDLDELRQVLAGSAGGRSSC